MSFTCRSIFCTCNGSDFTIVRLDEIASSIFVLSIFTICSKHSFSSRLVTIVNPLQLSRSKQHHYARLVQPLPPNLFFLFYTTSFVYFTILPVVCLDLILMIEAGTCIACHLLETPAKMIKVV